MVVRGRLWPCFKLKQAAIRWVGGGLLLIASTPLLGPAAVAQSTGVGGVPADGCPDKPKFSWKIVAPSTLSIAVGEPIPIAISVGACKASGIKLKVQKIYEKTLGEALPGLSLRGPDNDKSPFEINPGQEKEYTLVHVEEIDKLDPSYRPHGDFVGSVIIAADQILEGEVVKVDVAITSAWAYFFGAIALGIGVFGSSRLTPIIPDPDPDAPIKPARGLSEKVKALWATPKSFEPVDASADAAVRGEVEELLNADRGLPEPERRTLARSSTLAMLSTLRGAGERRQMMLTHLHKARAQLLISATSVALGFSSLVFTTSFGTLKDYVACVLYGIGAPLGSKAITSLVALAAR